MAEPTSDMLCAICTAPGSNTCSGCHQINYCSKVCRKVDWPLHKLLCKAFSKNFSDDKRPQPEHPGIQIKRAIYFPENGDGPRFIWLQFFGPGYDEPDVLDSPALGPDIRNIAPVKAIQYNGVLHRAIDREIFLAAKVRDINDKKWTFSGNPNKSLLKVGKELSVFWKGPLLAYGAKTDEKCPNLHHDLEPVDLRHIVDDLRMYLYESSIEKKPYIIGEGETIKGVRFNCLGDQAFCKRAEIEPRDVLKAACDMECDIKATVADKAGFPLVFRKLPQDPRWRGRLLDGSPYADNTAAALLDPETTLDTTRLATATSSTDKAAVDRHLRAVSGQIGSLIVVRKDGEPFKPMLMKALNEYASQKTDEAFQSVQNTSMLASHVLASISPEDFKKWYFDFVL